MSPSKPSLYAAADLMHRRHKDSRPAYENAQSRLGNANHSLVPGPEEQVTHLQQKIHPLNLSAIKECLICQAELNPDFISGKRSRRSI